MVKSCHASSGEKKQLGLSFILITVCFRSRSSFVGQMAPILGESGPSSRSTSDDLSWVLCVMERARRAVRRAEGCGGLVASGGAISRATRIVMHLNGDFVT